MTNIVNYYNYCIIQKLQDTQYLRNRYFNTKLFLSGQMDCLMATTASLGPCWDKPPDGNTFPLTSTTLAPMRSMPAGSPLLSPLKESREQQNARFDKQNRV